MFQANTNIIQCHLYHSPCLHVSQQRDRYTSEKTQVKERLNILFNEKKSLKALKPACKGIFMTSLYAIKFVLGKSAMKVVTA